MKMIGDQGKGWDRAAVDLDMTSVTEVSDNRGGG